MAPPHLFSHLAGRSVVQRETRATEALCRVLGRSGPARRALIGMFEGAGLPADLRFRTQATGGDGVGPTLVGEDEGGRPVLVVEGTLRDAFLAAQPAAYLERLGAVGGRTLVLLGPARGVRALWRTLVRRCWEEDLFPDDFEDVVLSEVAGGPGGPWGEDVYSAAPTPGHTLVLTSWPAVLEAMLVAVESAGDTEAATDVRELHVLREQVDGPPFLPLTSEELAGPTAARVVQYGQIVDRVAERLVRGGDASGRGARASSGNGWYGWVLAVGSVRCLLHVNASQWRDHAPTPLWLRVHAPVWEPPSAALRERVRQHCHEAQVTYHEGDEGIDVPLVLPLDAGMDEIVAAVHGQLVPLLDQVREYDPEAPADPGAPTDEPPRP